MTEGSPARLPLVSVVTICYNMGCFLAEAIDSVLTQTYPRWELLVVDDGSTDDSQEIAQRYAAQWPDRVRLLQHENRGNAGKVISRNLGVARANGEYLTFLDADDVFLPDKLAHQVGLLEAVPGAALVYGKTRYWSSWGWGQHDRDYMPPIGVQPGRLYAPPALMTAYLSNPGAVPCICALLARTATVRALGAFDASVDNMFEDQLLIAKLCLTQHVYVDEHCGELYRQHAGSSSAAAVRSRLYHPTRPNAAQQKYLDWLDDYVSGIGVIDASFRAALQEALVPYRQPLRHRWRQTRAGVRRAARPLRGRGMPADSA